MGVGHGGIEQRQLRGRAQHHDLAAQVLKVPDVLVEALWRDVMGRHPQHRQLNRVFGLVGGGHAVGEVVQGQVRGHAQAAIFKLVEHGLAGQVVFFQQGHAVAEQRRNGQVFNIIMGFGQVDADPEHRAFTRLAFDANLAAHLLHQTLGNDQAQTGPAGLARQRIVSLTEGLEQRPHILIGQADAGVLHADAQLYAAAGFVVVVIFKHGPHGDRAFAGELDRVVNQVGEDLLEPQRVAHQRQRRVAVHQADQLQAFLVGRGGEHGQGVLEQIAQVERGAVEHQLAGFDFREVENLVDDAEQVVGRLFDGVQVIELARGEFAFLQQVGEAQNAIERRTDFVAHVGQKF